MLASTGLLLMRDWGAKGSGSPGPESIRGGTTWSRTCKVKKGRAAVHEACPLQRSTGIVGNMTASTVAEYLDALPADRRAALSAVRKAINENLPEGYEEGMQFGMIGWYVPLSMYPAGYGENPKVPLPLVALASQKSGMVLHFLCFYGHPTLSTWFTSEWSDWEGAT